MSGVEDEAIVCTAAATLALIAMLQRRNMTKKKRLWVRKWLERRPRKSVYHNLVRELSMEDHTASTECTVSDKKNDPPLFFPENSFRVTGYTVFDGSVAIW